MKDTSGATPALRAAPSQRSSSATCQPWLIASQPTASRASDMPVAWKRGSPNISAFWSAMPIVTAPAGAAEQSAAAAARTRAGRSVRRRGIVEVGVGSGARDLERRRTGHHGLLVAVGRRAAAEQDERLAGAGHERVLGARRDDDAVARGDVELVVG